jgi:hypothetical protein
MYVHDVISELNKNIVRIGNQDYYPVMKVIRNLNNLATNCIRWDVNDFEEVAKIKTSEEEWEEYYNKDMFGMALTEMIYKHDCNIGITWQTVGYYLDTYCKIKEYKPVGQY